jgi:hypothetical protein
VRLQSGGGAGVNRQRPPAEGLVAQLPWGTRLLADANMPTTDTAGGGSSQDIAIGFLGSDAWLFEAPMNANIFPEVLSGALQGRIRVNAYFGFLLPYGQSLSIASGSGFAAPTGAVTSITF